MILGHIFPHPFPEPFNGVEVRTVSWQGKEDELQSSSGVLNEFGFVARRPIPDDNSWAGGRSQPGDEMIEELDGGFAVAAVFIPNEALTVGEVISTIPVNPILQRWAIAQTPSRFSFLCPGVAQVHVAVKVRFVDVDKPDLFLTDQGKGRLELLDVGGSFGSVGFLENFLTFLPTQPMLFQNLVQGTAADFTAEDLFDPTAQLLYAPVVPR